MFILELLPYSLSRVRILIPTNPYLRLTNVVYDKINKGNTVYLLMVHVKWY